MVYMLLPNKTRETYNQAFTLLKETAQSQGIHIRPDTIVTDFEVGLIQAVELNFPIASLTGCYFHFTQALWRKIQGVGLQTEYCAENSEVAPFFRKVAALAFVPLAFVRVAWQGLQVKYYSSLHNIYT